MGALSGGDVDLKHDAKEASVEQGLRHVLVFEGIHADSYDEAVKRRTCVGQLSDGVASLPIKYEIQIDDRGEVVLRGDTDNVTVRDLNLFTQEAVGQISASSQDGK